MKRLTRWIVEVAIIPAKKGARGPIVEVELVPQRVATRCVTGGDR